jgi:hypothetical protein
MALSVDGTRTTVTSRHVPNGGICFTSESFSPGSTGSGARRGTVTVPEGESELSRQPAVTARPGTVTGVTVTGNLNLKDGQTRKPGWRLET